MNAIPLSPDARLERDIERAKMQFMFAQSVAERESWLRTFEALIARRSPEQVRRMEREKGLLPPLGHQFQRRGRR